MIVFRCDDRYEDVMSCIYDAWIYAVKHGGHERVRIEKKRVSQPTLFDEYMDTETDQEKAFKITEAIKTKISNLAYVWVYRAAMSSEKDSPDYIYRFLIAGFKHGPLVTSMLTDDSVMKMMELNRRIGSEVHHFIEFIRFTSVDGRVYVSHIEPKSNVVEMVAPHFQDRMPSEYFIIVDDIRKQAVVHPKDEDFYLKQLTEDEYMALLELDSYRDCFSELWQTFFDAIAIKQRINPGCQRSLFPVWLRKHVTEFD